ncbi:MAG: flagellar hook-length control protein FliK, partial [Pirellulaceae bacterium]
MKTNETSASIAPPGAAQHGAAAPTPAQRRPFERLLRDNPAERSPELALPSDDCQGDCIEEEQKSEHHSAESVAQAAAMAVAPVVLVVPAALVVGEDSVPGMAKPGSAAESAEAGMTGDRLTGMPLVGMPTAGDAEFEQPDGIPSDASETVAGQSPAVEGTVSIPSAGQPLPEVAIEPMAPGDEAFRAGKAAVETEGTPEETAATAEPNLQSPSAPSDAVPAGKPNQLANGADKSLPASAAIDPIGTVTITSAESNESAQSPGSAPAIVTAGEPAAARGMPFDTPSLREPAAARAAALVEIDSPRLLNRVARAFQIAQQRGRELTLRLSPPELGSLRLELHIQDGVMTAKLEAETPTARTALIENLPALRERLAEQGIRIERFDVDLMQQQGEGARDHATDRESGRVREWESARSAKRQVETTHPLTP